MKTKSKPTPLVKKSAPPRNCLKCEKLRKTIETELAGAREKLSEAERYKKHWTTREEALDEQVDFLTAQLNILNP